MASTNIDVPEDQFHMFPKLPMELRLKIWEAACPRPRIFTLTIRRHGRGGSHYRYELNRAAVPAVLQVCHESRSEWVKRYELVPLNGIMAQDNEHLPLTSKDEDGMRFCRVDFQCDYFMCSMWWKWHEDGMSTWRWEHAERLVIAENDFFLAENDYHDFDELTVERRFPVLKELTVYATDYKVREERVTDFGDPDNLQLLSIAPDDDEFFEASKEIDKDQWGPPGYGEQISWEGGGLEILRKFNEVKDRFPAGKLTVLEFARIENIIDPIDGKDGWTEDSEDEVAGEADNEEYSEWEDVDDEEESIAGTS